MSEPAPAIVVRNLTRSFGSLRAVDGLSFEAQAGEVVGFIGANGAGKTTTMRILATLDMPDSGSAKIGGYDVSDDPNEVRKILGWVPDAFAAYDNLTVGEYVDFFARAHGYRQAERRDRVEEILNFTGLASLSERLATKMSKGQTQRLCLCRALLHDPKVLILDEPAAGLDPQARVELKQLIRILSEEGRTLLISSHILSELAEMCDTMLFIDNGKLVHHGSAESLTHYSREDGALVTVEVAGDIGPLRDWCTMSPGLEIFDDIKAGFRLRFEDASAEALAAQLRRMVEAGLAVTEFRRERQRLEDAFVSILSAPRAVAPVPPPLPGERAP